MGALEPCASRTNLMIWASIVSAPTLVARYRSEPVALIVAPMTVSPTALVTGIDSPVTIDSSTGDEPLTTSPSTGNFSPGLMTTMSPTRTSSTSTSSSWPSRAMRAVRGWRPIRARIASPVPAFALVSSSRPTRIRVTMTPTAS